jgi:O-antigen ligase
MLTRGLRIANGRIDIESFAGRAIPILFLAYPILLLSVRDGTSVCYVLLLVLSLFYLSRLGWRRIDWSYGDIAFAFAMACLTAATLISQLYHRSFHFASLDGPSRFLFAVPIYLMLRSIPLSYPRALEYGFPFGALAGLLTSIFFPPIYWTETGTYFVDPAQFGAGILTLGFLSVSTINWTRRDPLQVVVLKIAGFVVGIYGAIQTGERGVWIAIPVLATLLAFYRLSRKWSAVAAVIAIIAGLASYWVVPTVHDRIVYTRTEVESIRNRNFDTSLGLRLQIWNAGVEIVRENPIAGVGPEEVDVQFRAMHERGWFTTSGFEAALSQIHNEILANTVRLGIFGLLSILVIYFIPMILFIKTTTSVNRMKRVASVMGILFVCTYFITGLTIETFNIKMFATFYALTVATLLAIAYHTMARDVSDVILEARAIK